MPLAAAEGGNLHTGGGWSEVHIGMHLAPNGSRCHSRSIGFCLLEFKYQDEECPCLIHAVYV